MLSNIKIVLVETSHPGNIGGVARAMKNMGMNQLRLVNPKLFPNAEATARASGADDVLFAAQVYPTLAEALADCQIVFGASARRRTIRWPQMTAREAAQHCAQTIEHNNIALVFGRENSGLNNAELDLCHYLLKIPCHAGFSSLNLVAAVQVVSYELFMNLVENQLDNAAEAPEYPLANAAQMESFYQHLQQTLFDIGFLEPAQAESLMRRLRKLYNRTHLDTKELDILRGIFRFSQNHNQ